MAAVAIKADQPLHWSAGPQRRPLSGSKLPGRVGWDLVGFRPKAVCLQQGVQNEVGGFDNALVTRSQIRTEDFTGKVL
jgi:hypothetical protein